MSPILERSDAVLVAIRQIIRAVDLHSKRLVQQQGVTGPQLVVLKQLARVPTATTSELATAVSLSAPTVTGILHRLETRGLIERTKSERDRRKTDVALSERGRALTDAVRSALQERFIAKLHELADWEQMQILATLQRVAFMMEAAEIEASPVLVTGPVGASADDTLEFLGETAETSAPPSGDPSSPSVRTHTDPS